MAKRSAGNRSVQQEVPVPVQTQAADSVTGPNPNNRNDLSTRVIDVFDWAEEEELLETVRRFAADPAGGHVYEVYPETDMYIVSARPLAPRTAKRIFYQHLIDLATQEMSKGATAQEIRDTYGLSGQHIGQIAKKLGIKLRRGWFSAILATEEERERQSSKSIGPTVQVDVTSPPRKPSVACDPQLSLDFNGDRTQNASAA